MGKSCQSSTNFAKTYDAIQHANIYLRRAVQSYTSYVFEAIRKTLKNIFFGIDLYIRNHS